MNILVSGGCGFIGSNFIRYWLDRNKKDTIVNLDKLTYAGNLHNLDGLEDASRYTFIRGDICDRKMVASVFRQNIDLIVHFAAESHVDRSIADPSGFIRTNVEGTSVLLEAAVKNKVNRFHHISTDEVFGSLPLGSSEKFNESTPYNPRSPYAASKASSDHVVRAYGETYGLEYTISNCSNNYGPYQHPEKLIPLTITNLLRNEKVPVYGNGANIRDWLFVTDHCRAVEAVIREGKAGETYCVGGLKKDISNLEVIKKILQIMGFGDEDMIRFVKDRPGHDLKYAIDFSKIGNELGWQPLHDFDTWLEKTVHWYKENTGWWKPLRDRNFDTYYRKQYKDI